MLAEIPTTKASLILDLKSRKPEFEKYPDEFIYEYLFKSESSPVLTFNGFVLLSEIYWSQSFELSTTKKSILFPRHHLTLSKKNEITILYFYQKIMYIFQNGLHDFEVAWFRCY